MFSKLIYSLIFLNVELILKSLRKDHFSLPLTPNLTAFGFLSCLALTLVIIINTIINILIDKPVILYQNKKFKNVCCKNNGATV